MIQRYDSHSQDRDHLRCSHARQFAISSRRFSPIGSTTSRTMDRRGRHGNPVANHHDLMARRGLPSHCDIMRDIPSSSVSVCLCLCLLWLPYLT